MVKQWERKTTHSVNVKHVDRQVVSSEPERLEHVPQTHLLPVGRLGDDLARARPHRLLDEAQEVLLVHARRGVDVRVHLADVVKVAVRDGLLLGQLVGLVEQRVEVELGRQVLQAAVAVCFPAKEKRGEISIRTGHYFEWNTVNASNFGPDGNLGPFFFSEWLAIFKTRPTGK